MALSTRSGKLTKKHFDDRHKTVLKQAREIAHRARKKRLASLSWTSWFIWLGVGVIDYVDGALIYAFYFVRDTMPVVAPTLRTGLAFGLFPITATAALIYAICATVSAIIEREPDAKTQKLKLKTEDKIRLGYNWTMAGLAWAATILGLALGGGIYTLVIYGCSLTLSSVYQLSCMAYHGYQVRKLKKEIEATKAAIELEIQNDPAVMKSAKKSEKDGKTHALIHAKQMERIKNLMDEQESRRSKALSHFVIGSTSILIAIAGLCVGTFGWPAFASLGIAASLAGAIFFAVGYYKSVKAKHKKESRDEKGIHEIEETCVSTDNYVFKVLGQEKKAFAEDMSKNDSWAYAPKAGAFGRLLDIKGSRQVDQPLPRVNSFKSLRSLKELEHDDAVRDHAKSFTASR